MGSGGYRELAGIQRFRSDELAEIQRFRAYSFSSSSCILKAKKINACAENHTFSHGFLTILLIEPDQDVHDKQHDGIFLVRRSS